MMTDVFISYASANAEIANKLRSNLEMAGIKCWIAPRDIPPGSEYGEEIIKGIENTRVFLLCLTKESNVSRHVAREVERAVNKNLPILTYQHEEVILTKSLEYFLASTQWFTPNDAHKYDLLVHAIHALITNEEESVSYKVLNSKTQVKKSTSYNKFNSLWLLLSVILFIAIGTYVFCFVKPGEDKQAQALFRETSLKFGDGFSFGSMDYNGQKEALSWLVLNTDEKNNTVLCLAQNIVVFQPYDVAESGTRGQIGDDYFHEDSCPEYTFLELQSFWGNADWSSSNIRTWLNSSKASVTYSDMSPIDNGTTIYENGYETKPGFLYFFSDEERNQLITYQSSYVNITGDMVETKEYVFLLSKDEVQKYILDQNLLLYALPTSGAIKMDGSNIYSSYQSNEDPKAFWALRDYGNIPSCTILCVGNGMESEQFLSKYACDSLIGIRPAMVLPLSYVEELIKDKND